jgi:hypothetical protein
MMPRGIAEQQIDYIAFPTAIIAKVSSLSNTFTLISQRRIVLVLPDPVAAQVPGSHLIQMERRHRSLTLPGLSVLEVGKDNAVRITGSDTGQDRRHVDLVA